MKATRKNTGGKFAFPIRNIAKLGKNEIKIGMNAHFYKPQPEIVIGPIFIQSPPAPSPSIEVESVGVSLELATEEGRFDTPLYRNIKTAGWHGDLSSILIETDRLPFEFTYRPIFAVQTSVGVFVPLESFLVGLYEQFPVHRSIFDVFTELRGMIEFSQGGTNRFQTLTDAAARLGFAVTTVNSYGRRLFVDVDWIPPQDRGQAARKLAISSTAIDFRPRPDGTLGEGKWIEPKDGFARVLLNAELRRAVTGRPINLFTDAGKQELLSHFEWTPLARMNAKQAQQARMQFVREHLDLTEDVRRLAEAMQRAGLYSELSTVWSIAKHLPSLIATAQAERTRDA